MPTLLRSRIALLALLATFLIPIVTSSLRGLTHVLTCRGEARTPFSMIIPEEGDPLITTSTRLTRGAVAKKVCGGLELNMRARINEEGEILMVLPIRNSSKFDWRGTVKLEIEDIDVPVAIGEIEAGQTERDVVPLRGLREGTHEVNGSLLIGP
jgi:hypothetical protein